VHRLSFGFPWPECDFEASNRFAAEQASQDSVAGALMLVRPTMSLDDLDEQFRSYGFLGLKPYRVYAKSGDSHTCGITDFLPEEQIEFAHRHSAIIMLHLSKRDAIADESNIEDLRRLTSKYSNAKWILAHCGRSYAAWPIERAAKRLRDVPNIWFDVSSVCESDAIAALLDCFGPDRVMYGSDDLPVGALRGKYVTFGYAWSFISENNHSLELSHCNPQMTFVRYEQLRAMRRAAIAENLSSSQIADLFFNTAFRLVEIVRAANRDSRRSAC
jgi:glutamate-1-semialdehyde 2,1-aminomutase